MRAFVELITNDQRLELVHGDFIGRLRSAALHIDDARISEAHAMVSLREGAFRLLSLRGAFALAGLPQRDVILQPGQQIHLAQDVAIEVGQVVIPPVVLGIETPDGTTHVLPPVASIHQGRVQARYREDAEVLVWTVGDAWRYRQHGETAPLEPGLNLRLETGAYSVVLVPMGGIGKATEAHHAIQSPLHIVASYDSVHIQRDGATVLSLSGLLARLISELVAVDGPMGWTLLAEALWPGTDPGVTRPRLDVNLNRLRQKLRQRGLRTDLVQMLGTGQVELVLGPNDQVQDNT